MTVISAKNFLTFGLAILLPLALGACGNAGSGSALKNSAHLTPPPLQENKKTASVPSVSMDKPSADAKKLPKLAAKTPDKEAKQPITPKAGKTIKPIINAKAGSPPMPVRRPYRKVRKKSAARMVTDQKPSADSAKKVMAKAVVKPKIQARAKPVATSTIVAKTPITPKAAMVAKTPKAEMVPVEAVRAQVAPEEAPDLMFGGFIDGSGINASHEVSAAEVRAAKMEQAQSVAKKPSFGQSEFRFSSQK